MRDEPVDDPRVGEPVGAQYPDEPRAGEPVGARYPDEPIGEPGRPTRRSQGPEGAVSGQPDRDPERPPAGLVFRGFARTVVALRFLIVPAWIAATVLAVLYLPPLTEAQTQGFSNLIPQDTPALRAEIRSLREFSFPVIARSVVVQRNPRGLPPDVQARALRRAATLDSGGYRDVPEIAGAIPIANTLRLLPSSRERGTTVLTYLFFRPSAGLPTQVLASQRFARNHVNAPGDALVGVTGAAPGRLEQANLIERALPWVELATVLLIVGILALTFRAVAPPLVALVAAGIAYLISIRAVAWAGRRAGISVPQELEPVIVVLLLGVVTDYTIFFLFGMRDRLRAGDAPAAAVRWTTATFGPIILTAGLTVAAGTAALLVARLQFLRAFGPALAIGVVVTLVVAMTFVPAALALLGRLVFWPNDPARGRAPLAHGDARPWRARLSKAATTRPIAILIVLVAGAALVFAGLGLRHARLGFSMAGALPADTTEARAQEAAASGFAPGITSPTEILLERQGIGAARPALGRLQALISHVPGVAGVIGPAQQPSGRNLALSISKDGNAARYVAILGHEPLSGQGVADLRRIQAAMPGLLRRAGLGRTRVSYAGDTALVQETIQRTVGDMIRVGAVILLLEFALLALLLRALVAPIYLLVTDVLALAATIGLTVFVFQDVLHRPDVTYYVPIAAAVLLISFGSDYEILLVGRIWEEARRMSLHDAVVLGSQRATRSIAIAGLTLAFSFALLAIVPLVPFRELAFAMAAGVLIDSFLVRSLLVPALISLFGRISAWPGKPAGEAVQAA